MKTRFKGIQFKTSEIAILMVVALMGVLANLPETYGRWIDRKLLLASLIAVVVIAMFRYLQLLLLMIIVILAIGANLPADMAQALGISQLALMTALGSMVAITLANRVFGLLPTGVEPDDAAGPSESVVPNFDTFVPDLDDARQFMLTAISKGDSAALRLLLAMNASINFVLNGTTPLHLAAEKGYSNIVQLLLDHGADPHALNAEGQTPLEVALAKKKFARTTEILFNVTKFLPAKEA